jgi:hypothetical protein
VTKFVIDTTLNNPDIPHKKGIPMPVIKDMAKISAKWKRVTSAATQEYTEGIQNPRTDWAVETAKAEAAYEKGIQASIGRKSFGKGVRAAGTEKWKSNAIEKGPMRFSQGVGLGAASYEKGFAPFREIIANTNLPARGPKGDPSNINRVAVMAKAMHDKKLSQLG